MVQREGLGVRQRRGGRFLARGAIGGGSFCLVVAAALALGCEITVPCPPAEQLTVHIPSGTFAPAIAHHSMKTVGAPFFASTFPRGTADPTLAASTALGEKPPPPYDPGDFPGTAETVPSAVLAVDPEARIVVRSYVNAYGQLIEERWRFKERQ